MASPARGQHGAQGRQGSWQAEARSGHSGHGARLCGELARVSGLWPLRHSASGPTRLPASLYVCSGSAHQGEATRQVGRESRRQQRQPASAAIKVGRSVNAQQVEGDGILWTSGHSSPFTRLPPAFASYTSSPLLSSPHPDLPRLAFTCLGLCCIALCASRHAGWLIVVAVSHGVAADCRMVHSSIGSSVGGCPSEQRALVSLAVYRIGAIPTMCGLKLAMKR